MKNKSDAREKLVEATSHDSDLVGHLDRADSSEDLKAVHEKVSAALGDKHEASIAVGKLAGAKTPKPPKAKPAKKAKGTKARKGAKGE